ncbi:uncharacterized protein LOC141612929 [Silene latifolia]|uniref:uncharacterized protein LOC141612842 n=1 Tax=Silene latifolia TaxID=37657 RepID=UPI003D772743
MDQNLPIVTKKLWNIIRAVFYILKKNINKKKILLDLNLFIKRGKFVAEKTLTNLIYNHHQNNHHVTTAFEDEYEFSCTNTPLYRHYLTTNKPKNKHLDLDAAMWDLMVAPKAYASPKAKKLRVTDSPYPMQNEGGEDGVDAAAEEFIKRFYSQLKQET